MYSSVDIKDEGDKSWSDHLTSMHVHEVGNQLLLTGIFCLQHAITFAINFIQRSTKKKKETETTKDKEKPVVRSDEADSSRTLVSDMVLV